MPRTLPAELTTALDLGSFIPYFTIGQRTWSGGVVTAYTTLISDGNIIYYKYDGLNLTVKWHSENLPSVDGFTLGEYYYIERGVQVSGTPYTIKSGSLHFDDYEYQGEICTAKFSLFSNNIKPPSVAADDTYTNVITALIPNPEASVLFATTPENNSHWGYNFYATGETLALPGYDRLLSLLHKKYLIRASDNSDDDNEDEVRFYHLRSPINSLLWVARTATNKNYNAVAYAPEIPLLVAVGSNTTNGAETSPDGITWTLRNTFSLNFNSICWSPELSLFCAVGVGGTNYVSISSDGINWTDYPAQTAGASGWNDVAWSPSLGLFCAVAGATNFVMTSPDGINWTVQTAAENNNWQGICWSADLSLFVAVAISGTNRVMTSPDGITWTARAAAEANQWLSICWSSTLALFCAVSNTGTNRAMTSPDGITWTARAIGARAWNKVTASELNAEFLACTTTYVSTSPDAITWTEESPGAYDWRAAIFAEDLETYVLVSTGGATPITTQLPSMAADFEITWPTIKLLSASRTRFFFWTDEASATHTSGDTDDIMHDLGYLESTDLPPSNYSNSERAFVEIPIHLKYKSGDILKLYIKADEIVTTVTTATSILLEDDASFLLLENGDNILLTEETTTQETISQSAMYHANVVEIFDPNHAIGWRNVITLVERFGTGSARYSFDGSTYWPDN